MDIKQKEYSYNNKTLSGFSQNIQKLTIKNNEDATKEEEKSDQNSFLYSDSALACLNRKILKGKINTNPAMISKLVSVRKPRNFTMRNRESPKYQKKHKGLHVAFQDELPNSNKPLVEYINIMCFKNFNSEDSNSNKKKKSRSCYWCCKNKGNSTCCLIY